MTSTAATKRLHLSLTKFHRVRQSLLRLAAAGKLHVVAGVSGVKLAVLREIVEGEGDDSKRDFWREKGPGVDRHVIDLLAELLDDEL